MKKLLSLLLIFNALSPLTACSSQKDEKKSSEVATSEEKRSSEEQQFEADKQELEALGDVEVNNGILTVSITIPATYENDVTQESLDQGAGDTYMTAKLNEDGSVTYKMTKPQHALMLKTLLEGIDSASKEMIDNEQYAFTEIKHNADCTQFDVTLSTTEVGIYEAFAAMAFYVYGGMYGIFSGHPADKVIVNYYDPSGNLIESGDSSQLGNN